MASLSSQRIANTITWTLNLTARSRTIALSFSSTDHTRHSSRRSSQSHRQRGDTRCFSSRTSMRQEAAQPKPAPSTSTTTPTASSFPSAKPAPPREPPPTTARNESIRAEQEPIRELSKGLSDGPKVSGEVNGQIDWATSFHGMSEQPFPKEAQEVLMQPINADDIEIKGDGLIYLPEIKYRRILNKAFGPGAWGMAPRGETIVTSKSVTREYALLVNGRLVSIARGEQDYFDKEGIPTATEGCKSNALMRCCKDLGIASELWDPRFIRSYFKKHTKDVWAEHVVTKKRKKLTLRKDDEVTYPFKEVKSGASGAF